MLKHSLTLLLSLACLVGLLPGRTVAAAQQDIDVARLERVALAELQDTRTPGAAVALIRDGKVMWARGFGVSSVETAVPVTPDMLFRLGSSTKMLTAAVLVGLAEDGKLTFDAPIGRYVPGLSSKLAAVTLDQLLSHRAGLRDEATMFGLHDDSALGQTVRAITDDFFFAEPGRVFSYANPGYWVAGFVGEVVAGKPYADLMNERLFEPLGMKRTTLRPTLAMTYPLAQGHEAPGNQPPRVGRPAADNVGNWPAGSVFSSVEDLSRFVVAFMDGGVLDGRQVLAQAVVARMSAPRVEVPGSEPRSYGYGLMTSVDRGVRVLEHGGSRSGYGSVIRMAPERHAAVIILANRTGASLPKTAAAAMDLLLSRDPKPELPAPREVPMAQSEMQRYAGRYSQTKEVEIELLVQDGKLLLRQGGTTLQVIGLGDRHFGVIPAGQTRPQEFWIVLDPNGRDQYLYRGTRALSRLQ
jgi:CubicO group peptidase (beta-lactamase class C family)